MTVQGKQDSMWVMDIQILLSSFDFQPKTQAKSAFFQANHSRKQKETKNSFLLNGYTVSEKADFACFSHWKSELDNKINL